jgi:hypothetical protein
MELRPRVLMFEGTSAFESHESRIRIVAAQIARCLIRDRPAREVRYRTVPSYTNLLRATEPSVYWTDAPQTLPPNGELLFPDDADEDIRDAHRFDCRALSGFGFAAFNRVLVSGASVIGTPYSTFKLGAVVPGYIDAEFDKSVRSSRVTVGRRKLIRRSRRFVPGCSVVVTHWNSFVYGHWLLECMPKLLLLARELKKLPPFRIIVPSLTLPYVTAWIERTLPGIDIERLDQKREYLCCERLLMPTLLMDPYCHFHPALLPMLDELVGTVSPRADRKNLYVSRVAPSIFRELINREEIEGIAVEEGLTLVRPELLTIQEQMNLFAGAKLVVGEFGSAMHNTLFSGAGTRVLCLNWINELQSRIARLKSHSVGYLLPSNGKAVRFIPGAPRATYHIDPHAFRSRVRTLLG